MYSSHKFKSKPKSILASLTCFLVDPIYPLTLVIVLTLANIICAHLNPTYSNHILSLHTGSPI